ncbi:mitochondrial transcription termination factor (mTERF) family protein [Nitzschia inconspicua]|uniref:Mitochondrial transcription termination factor (mTERF) family protein n=1 Tax=Nitzschia inconspicua TaxID=303405 RepID=A0A9K3PBK5_9STRA|nr:mitochondrial transcription termination factor (mTERF) family protein [Nitzschia inconspicua]
MKKKTLKRRYCTATAAAMSVAVAVLASVGSSLQITSRRSYSCHACPIQQQLPPSRLCTSTYPLDTSRRRRRRRPWNHRTELDASTAVNNGPQQQQSEERPPLGIQRNKTELDDTGIGENDKQQLQLNQQQQQQQQQPQQPSDFIDWNELNVYARDDGRRNGWNMDGGLYVEEQDEMDFLEDLFLEDDDDDDDDDDSDDRHLDGSDIQQEEEDPNIIIIYTEVSSNETKSLKPTPLPLSLEDISPNLSYFYLRDELGLSEDIMWKITLNAPSVLGLKAETVRNKVQVLQSLMGLSDEEIRHVVSVQPTILQLSAKKNISPTVLYLQRQLDLSRKELRQLLIGNPSLLNYSLKNLHSKIVSFFQHTMGYTPAEVRKILLKDPWLLACSVHNGLLPRLEFLHREVKISSQDLRVIVFKNPKILRMSVDQNLQPKLIFFFILTLRMSPKDVSKLLLKYPQILDYHLERHIQPIYHYLIQLELLSSYEFANLLKRFPRFVTFSLARIKQRIGYLRYQLCLDAKSIRRILYQSPQVMSLSQENLETTIQFLLETVAPNATNTTTTLQYDPEDDPEVDLELAFDKRYLESDNDNNYNNNDGDGDMKWTMDDEEYSLHIIQTLISGMPSLLHLNVTTSLRPKVEYLRGVLGQDELSRALLTFPPLLGYSLENRIQPRLQKLVQAGIPGGKITFCLPMKEEAFDVWLERQTEKVQIAKTTAQRRVPKGRDESPNTKTESEALSSSTTSGFEMVGNREIKDGGRIIHWRRRNS